MFHSYKGLNIYYEKIGNGNPIIFLHGWGCSLNVFKSVANYVSKKYTVYLIDLPGFGKSSIPDFVVDIKFLSELINDFIETNKLIKPIIVGHSYGGRVASEYASTYTNINKLILIDSAGIKRFSLIKWIKIKIYKCKKIYYKLTKQVMKYNELICKSGSKDYVAANPILKKMLISAVNYDQKKSFKKISYETLIIWGSNDDSTPLKDGKKINKLISNSELIIISRSGHFPFIDNYSYFIKIIGSYLEV